MVAIPSQKVSLKTSKLTNLRTGQLLLGKGNKGSLAILNSNLSQETAAEEFPPLVASAGIGDQDQD